MILSVPYTVLRESPVARRSGFFGGCCRYGLDWGDTGAGKGAHVAGTGGTRMASAQAPVRVPRSSGLLGHALLAPGHHCDPWHLPHSCTAACRGRKPTCWWLADRCWVPDTLLHLGGRPNVLLVGERLVHGTSTQRTRRSTPVGGPLTQLALGLHTTKHQHLADR